ncbi:phage integrase family protein [Caballeronia sp. S22]|uniref:phage integrase family protein n=1 Tax=Caballeronia sp. S22 TaxID=3137182 RepID=UPI003530AF81
MANQPQRLTLPPPRTYTRTDFTALRAFVQRLPVATIARLYYDPERSPHAASADAMERFLGTMRDDLVHLALLHGSSVLADHLKASIKQHGSAKLTAMTLRMVEQASTLAAAVPLVTHPVHLWFRPLIAQRLNGEGIGTLGALIDYCNARGGSWWRSVPRIGALRARAIVAWLRRHETTLGTNVAADVDTASLVPAETGVTGERRGERPGEVQGADPFIVIGGDVHEPRLAPFEHLAVPAGLSGARGFNRATSFAFIRAEHDLAAVHAYLHRFRDRPTTLARLHARARAADFVERGGTSKSIVVADGRRLRGVQRFPEGAVAVFYGTQAPPHQRSLAPVRAGRSIRRQSGLRGAGAAGRLCVAGRGPLSRRQSVERGA